MIKNLVAENHSFEGYLLFQEWKNYIVEPTLGGSFLFGNMRNVRLQNIFLKAITKCQALKVKPSDPNYIKLGLVI